MHNIIEAIAKELAEYHEAAREVAKAQKVSRQKRVVHDDGFVIKNTKFKDLIIWKHKEMADLRERHESNSIRKEKVIADLIEKDNITHLIISRYIGTTVAVVTDPVAVAMVTGKLSDIKTCRFCQF